MVDSRQITDAIEVFRRLRLEVPEGCKAELLRGDILVSAECDWVDDDVVKSVTDQVPYWHRHRQQRHCVSFPRSGSETQPDLVILARDAATDASRGQASLSAAPVSAPSAARPLTTHPLVAFFEELEVPETFEAELLRGEIVMTAGTDVVHNRIIQSVRDQVPGDRRGRPKTQVAGKPVPTELITMLVEVVSNNSLDRDHRVKRNIYAAGEVPTYLIIDPAAAECRLLTDPTGTREDADYTVQRTTKFGDPIPLDLLGVKLDTTEFQTFTNVRPHSHP
ncbi:Uma2 family endonuclease [Streptomyces rimosus]|uniref:Putative restriction endonuclease domain-containing protein n=2 Tax=Streptomyces rimosus subsp. rimosus TaxID=132474 RepID=A0A8A1UMH8_STRR1|nr:MULTISPECIES: Uma2 family endonuclease [Streptomyces]MYT46544.1 hypothetical protein [Streptomyces sp. SID5471]QST81059.1 hypothetical protein SRIM_013565 [Streptomyces rimosus subsp. rimosus ATCC 10970]QDA06918.1 hypothetical protein CTZ40_27335 [Streptomyces rimosus]QEV81121.1 hypothetical protein CP984_27300 [Streptomyces rimosus]QGY69421.1 hypothetical protein V519_029255 [Streptomyces rimosus R6-500]